MIILFNKSDLLLATQKEELSAIFADMKVEKLFISAKKRENITILEKKLVQAAALPEVNQNDIIITNVRHYEALTRALDSIHRVQEGLQLELSGDLVSEDLRQCIHELSEIVAEGGITSEETLQNIFQKLLHRQVGYCNQLQRIRTNYNEAADNQWLFLFAQNPAMCSRI